jgi:hypothetical protein
MKGEGMDPPANASEQGNARSIGRGAFHLVNCFLQIVDNRVLGAL